MSASRNSTQQLSQQINMLKRASQHRYNNSQNRTSNPNQGRHTNRPNANSSFQPTSDLKFLNQQQQQPLLQRQESKGKSSPNIDKLYHSQAQNNRNNNSKILSASRKKEPHSYGFISSQRSNDLHKLVSGPHNMSFEAPLPEGLKATCKFQLPSQKGRSDSKTGSSAKSSNRDKFFSQRNSTRDSFKQVIKVYKEGPTGCKDDHQRQSFYSGSGKHSRNSLKGHQKEVVIPKNRNKSVPRPSAIAMMSSQEYSSTGPTGLKGNNLINSDKKGDLNLNKAPINYLSAGKQSQHGLTRTEMLGSPSYQDQTKKKQRFTNSTALNQSTQDGSIVNPSRTVMTKAAKKCSCPCSCPQQLEMTTQTTRMMSLLSSCQQNQMRNNTMTLKHSSVMNNLLGANSSALLQGDACDEINLEETHYLLVQVEKLKKRMLQRAEGSKDPYLEEGTDSAVCNETVKLHIKPGEGMNVVIIAQ